MIATPNLFDSASVRYFDACRTQFSGALQIIDACAAGAERLRAVQMGAAHDIQAKHVDVGAQIVKAGSMQELMVLQARLMNEYGAAASVYWNSLSRLAQENQSELVRLCWIRVQEALRQSGVTEPAAGAPAMDMQSVFDTMRTANESFLKTLTGAYLQMPQADKSSRSARAGAA